MSNFVYGSRFIQAAMLRMCLAAIFVGLAVAAHTARSEESPFTRDLDILTIQPVYSGTEWLFPYRLDMNIALAHSEDNAPAGSVSGNTLRLRLISEPKEEASWPTSARWRIAPDGERTSLSPVLRFESKGGRIEIKPRRQSIWVVWRKTFY